MCGICGYTGPRRDGVLEAMTDSLRHRGPDDEGFHYGDGVALGHRRLSIIDLAGGHQPLANEDGSIVLICNGEIYNHRELRERLLAAGHRFRTQSDCEVILHLYEDRGDRCVHDLIGMFAFALWDARQRRLLLVRDRLGIKPLYYARTPQGVFFGSEMKALLRADAVPRELEPAAVQEYLALRHVPGPGTLLRGVSKLPAAHYAVIDAQGFDLQRYWQPKLHEGPFDLSDDEYLEGFAEHFERSVKRRLMADVPVGAFLSGGLDSSVIVSAFARMSSEPVRTFTVGFDFEHDEVDAARRAAEALGCIHTEITCRASDMAELLPDVVWHLDEPIGDPIVIPMYMLSREAARHVKVVLSGEGADETLGGYLFHRALLYGGRLRRVVPPRLVAGALRAMPSALLDIAFDYPADLGRRGKQKVIDFLGLLGDRDLLQAYRHLISLFDARDTAELYQPEFRAQLNGGSAAAEEARLALASAAPLLGRILHLQFDWWLADNILTKQDKTSMAHALEARVPFLDHELVEFALRVPPRLKIHRGRSKELLRRYAARSLPAEITRRPKRPFYAPLERDAGAREFRDLVEDTLNEQAVRERGLFRPERIARLRDSLAGGEFMHVKQVFSLVALELWFRQTMDRAGVR